MQNHSGYKTSTGKVWSWRGVREIICGLNLLSHTYNRRGRLGSTGYCGLLVDLSWVPCTWWFTSYFGSASSPFCFTPNRADLFVLGAWGRKTHTNLPSKIALCSSEIIAGVAVLNKAAYSMVWGTLALAFCRGKTQSGLELDQRKYQMLKKNRLGFNLRFSFLASCEWWSCPPLASPDSLFGLSCNSFEKSQNRSGRMLEGESQKLFVLLMQPVSQ